MNAVIRLLRNVGSNYLKVGVDGLIIIALTPYLVNELGVALYAVWIIVQTIGYYLGFLDLGVADAQVQRHSVLEAQGRTAELGRLHGTVLTFFTGAGLVAVALAALVAALPTAELFDIPADAREVYGIALPLLGVAVLFAFVETAMNGLFESYQRYDLMNAIDIVGAVLEAAALVAALYFGYGLVGLAVVKASFSVLGAAAKTVFARRLFPAYAFPVPGFDRESWRSIRGFSLWNSLNDLVTEGTAHFDKLLIPVLLGSALVTPYSLTLMLAAVVFIAAEPITGTFFPIAARRHGKQDTVALGVLLTRGTRIVNVATLPATVVVLCFGTAILDLWIGAEQLEIAPAVLWLIVLNFYFSTYLWTSLSVLMGCGRVKQVFWVSVLEVAVVLALILLLAPRYGLVGFAFAGLVANVAIGLAFFVPHACRLAGVEPWRFIGSALLRPAAAALPALVLGLWLAQGLQPQAWLATGAAVAATAALAAICVFFAATSRWERARQYATARRVLGLVGAVGAASSRDS